MITRLGREESLALLRARRLGRLGCVADGEPYVVPINYVFEAETGGLLSHSLPGRKIAAMRERPRVCLQVDDISDQLNWSSVIAYAAYEEITSPAARARAVNLLLSLFPELTPVETLVAGDAAAPPPVVFRLRVERVTGVREG